MKSIANLKIEVKRLAAQGKNIAKLIQQSSGLTRYSFWQDKRSLGIETRYHLLAYGFLRGLSYERIEPRCRLGNEPRTYALYEVVQRFSDGLDRPTEEAARAWLQVQAVAKAA